MSWKQALAYLLLLSVEIIVYMVVAVKAAPYINELGLFPWDAVMITAPISVLLGLWSFYKFFVKIIKSN